MKKHASEDVQKAIVQLSDALCQWERSTGIESVFILREQGGFEYRAISGKPGIPNNISNEQLIKHMETQ